MAGFLDIRNTETTSGEYTGRVNQWITSTYCAGALLFFITKISAVLYSPRTTKKTRHSSNRRQETATVSTTPTVTSSTLQPNQ